MKKLMMVVAIAATMVGCASVPMGDAQADAKAKQFVAPPDKSAVYIYRNESMGASVKMDVALDGKPIGQTAANTYLYTQVAPGKHVITSTAENTDSVEIDAKPGSLYYIWQEVKMGILFARNKLHVVDAAQGQKGVEETKLAVTQ